MSMNTYQQHVQSVSAAKDAILGQLCWYSIPEETVDHDTVAQLCKANNIENYTPAPPRPPDVFRRACKAASRRIGRKDDPQRFFYEFKAIDKDNNQILMKLVRETVDAATNQGIDWSRMANVTFQRDTETIDVVGLPDLDDEGRDVLRTMKATFADENGKVNSAHLRRMIQQVLNDSLATAVRPSGGIYFVTEANAKRLGNVAKVINDLPVGSSMHLLPLVDTADQRKMLHAAVEAELANDMDAQLTKVVDILKSGKPITADKFTQLTSELHRSGRKGNEYANLLTQKLSVFESRQQIASDAIAKLADLVEVT